LWPRLEPAAETVVAVSAAEPLAAADLRPAPAKTKRPAKKERAVTELPKDLPGAPAPGSQSTPATPEAAAAPDGRISIDEFMKIDLRVARVLTAERVPGSKKLMKLQIDLGSEQRTIVAGIAEAYEADALVGRSIAIVANLKPAKLMGIESNGMVMAASPEGGKPILLAFDQSPPPGTKIR
jgi:methionyl-tRNA synthetase